MVIAILFRNIDHENQVLRMVSEKKGQCEAKTKLSAGNAFLNQLNKHIHPLSQTAKFINIKACIKCRT